MAEAILRSAGEPSSERPGGRGGAEPNACKRCIAFFGYDAAESTLIKRVRSFQRHNSRVIGFMFRRERGHAVRPPTWENIDLGVTIDRNYLRRIPKLIRAVAIALRYRDLLRRSEIWYARNIDMLLVAATARALLRSDAVLVYEVLDVQRIFLGQGAVNKGARWIERLLLGSCDLLVVSSPDFVDRYFGPQQRLSIPWRLLENKISGAVLPREGGQGERRSLAPSSPWVIGWFGTLRCVRSLEMLCRIADTLGENVRIILRGRPSEEDMPKGKIEAAIAPFSNMAFGGPYNNPDDLAEIYGQVHFSWSVDYLDAGTNSDWLLPNRIYEGGYYGALAIARHGTAVGRKVEREQLGWAFEEPLEQSVLAFLGGLTAKTYLEAKDAVLKKQSDQFVDESDTRDLLQYLDTVVSSRRSA